MLDSVSRNLLRVLLELSQLAWPNPPDITAPSFSVDALCEGLNLDPAEMRESLETLGSENKVIVDTGPGAGVATYGVPLVPGQMVSLATYPPNPGWMQEDAPMCPFSLGQTCSHRTGWLDYEVFVVGPNNPQVRDDVDAILAAVRHLDLDPYFASDDPATYVGRNAVCDKICGKLIETRFSIILRTAPSETFAVPGAAIIRDFPRPNVYFEYGLAMGFHRPVIPAQREGQTAEFDLATVDTILYRGDDLAGLSRLIEQVGRELLAKTQNWSTSISAANRLVEDPPGGGNYRERQWLRQLITPA